MVIIKKTFYVLLSMVLAILTVIILDSNIFNSIAKLNFYSDFFYQFHPFSIKVLSVFFWIFVIVGVITVYVNTPYNNKYYEDHDRFWLIKFILGFTIFCILVSFLTEESISSPFMWLVNKFIKITSWNLFFVGIYWLILIIAYSIFKFLMFRIYLFIIILIFPILDVLTDSPNKSISFNDVFGALFVAIIIGLPVFFVLFILSHAFIKEIERKYGSEISLLEYLKIKFTENKKIII